MATLTLAATNPMVVFLSARNRSVVPASDGHSEVLSMALDIDNAHKYPVLLDGEAGTLPPTAFGADNANVDIFLEGGVLKLKAHNGATGTTNLTVSDSGRTGAAVVNIANDPIDITLGDPEDL